MSYEDADHGKDDVEGQRDGHLLEQCTFHSGILRAACGSEPWPSSAYGRGGGSVGALADDEPWGGDENVRQVSIYRHRAWRAMPNRAILESKVVRLSPSRTAAPSRPLTTQRVSRLLMVSLPTCDTTRRSMD
jgi:hypothetical protein